MAKSPVPNYIVQARMRQIEDSHIRQNLRNAGWSEEFIEASMTEATILEGDLRAIPLPVPKPNTGLTMDLSLDIDASHFTASRILLYIGVIIVLIAGVTFVGINWTSWGPFARIFAIFLPMFVSYLLGYVMWKRPEQLSQSRAFVLVGGLLFPLFVAIVFHELKLFAPKDSDMFVLMLSVTTFLMYFVTSIVTAMPLWSPLAQIAGLSILFSFLRVMGFVDYQDTSTIAWIFLACGFGYYALALLYENRSEHIRALYTSTVSAVVMLLCLLVLYSQADSLASLLIVIFVGIALLVLGAKLEHGKYSDFCMIPYLLGFGTLLVGMYHMPSLVVYGKSGTALYYGQTLIKWKQDQVLWLTSGVGGMYILLSYVFETLKKQNYSHFTPFVELLRLIGPLVVLYSIFQLGLGGSHIFEEVLLLIASLAFIFGSIPRKIQQYLLVGTIFLIVCIFSAGGEYFQDQVGWPITLFITGLLSMGISVGIERIRRNYFKKS